MNKHVLSYLEFTNMPWGKLFYALIWKQLPELKNKNILDFGSGFGITAAHYSNSNNVVAIEPDREMISLGEYTGIECFNGSVESLGKLSDNSFDVIICHNVLEYLNDRKAVLKEFNRLLKPSGILSIVKHNRVGRIMQKIVLENDIEKAKTMISGKNAVSQKFGEIKTYSDDEIIGRLSDDFDVKDIYGIGAFYPLQRNEIKIDHTWFDTMLDLEMRVSAMDDFKHLAGFHHIIFGKRG